MAQLIIAVVLALISYFTTKKSGATTAQAAAVGAAAGLGTYYVATQTDWGKAFFTDTSRDWVLAKDAQGNVIKDEYGTDVYVPAGETAVLGADGKIKVAADGTWFTKTLDSTAAVLKSWGGAGTAAVIGTAAAAGSGAFSGLKTYMPWIIGGVLIFALVK